MEVVIKTGTRRSTFKVQEIVSDIMIYFYIALYFYTAYEKLKNHSIFENSLHFSELLNRFSVFLSWAVPIVEIIIGILLIVPKSRRLGLRLGTALMALFTLYLIYMLAFAELRTCECGGFISALTWEWHLVFNVVFIILGALAWYFDAKQNIYEH